MAELFTDAQRFLSPDAGVETTFNGFKLGKVSKESFLFLKRDRFPGLDVKCSAVSRRQDQPG